MHLDFLGYEAGATNSEYKISGGNFTQANVGGEAQYNNKNSSIGTVEKGLCSNNMCVGKLPF